MTPSKGGISTSIGKNFAETLIWNNSFFFITCIFLWKFFWALQTHYNFFFGPNVFFLIFLFKIHKKCIWYQFKIFSQKFASNKKNLCMVFKLQFFSKVFPNVGGNALFWRFNISENIILQKESFVFSRYFSVYEVSLQCTTHP